MLECRYRKAGCFVDVEKEGRMIKKKVLLAGESWVSAATHFKGHDQMA